MTPTKPESSKSDRALYDAREAVITAMPGIIQAIIKKALDGSYQHAKFLMDFASSESAEPSTQGDESLAALLMKELRDGSPADTA